jgi:hypothetical protein
MPALRGLENGNGRFGESCSFWLGTPDCADLTSRLLQPGVVQSSNTKNLRTTNQPCHPVPAQSCWTAPRMDNAQLFSGSAYGCCCDLVCVFLLNSIAWRLWTLSGPRCGYIPFPLFRFEDPARIGSCRPLVLSSLSLTR